jgi:hypothetical protein
MFATTDLTSCFTIAGAFVPSAGERTPLSSLSLSLSLPIGCRA